MSIVVYRDGIIAADTNCYGSNNLVIGEFCKIHRFGEYLVGTVGKSGQCNDFVRWISNNANCSSADILSRDVTREINTSECTAIMVDKSHSCLRFKGSNNPILLTGDFFVAGSGSEIATGALAQGATAIEAVKIAILYSGNCGGRAIHLELTK